MFCIWCGNTLAILWCYSLNLNQVLWWPKTCGHRVEFFEHLASVVEVWRIARKQQNFQVYLGSIIHLSSIWALGENLYHPPMLRFGFFCFVLKDGATKSDEFSEIPNCLRPPPSFSENYYYKFLVNGYGRICARRYEGQIVWNACTWYPEIGTILRVGVGVKCRWNLSENSSDLAPPSFPNWANGLPRKTMRSIAIICGEQTSILT